jgi:predicted nuclease with RNAse H fold
LEYGSVNVDRLKKLWLDLGIPSYSQDTMQNLLKQLFDLQFTFLRDAISLVASAIETRRSIARRALTETGEMLNEIKLVLGQFPRGIAYKHIEARRAHLERELHSLSRARHQEERLLWLDLFYLYRELVNLLYRYRTLRLLTACLD